VQENDGGELLPRAFIGMEIKVGIFSPWYPSKVNWV